MGLTLEHKLNISKSLKGKKKPPFTDRHRQNISLSKTGYKLTEEHKLNIAISKKGAYFSPEHRLKLSLAKLGKTGKNLGKKLKPLSEEHKLKISIARKGLTAREKHPMWKGGISPLEKIIRKSKDYKIWRKSVFERDDYTCQECKVRGLELNAHHIKPFAWFPELRLAIDNGVSLCIPCHKKTDSYAGKIQNKCKI